MRRADKTQTKRHMIALALTWDGSRWPVKKLPPKARAFLKGKSGKALAATATQLSKLFANDEIKEIRICWIPRLKGGDDVMTKPFVPPQGKRLGFVASRGIRFGDILGVIYRRR